MRERRRQMKKGGEKDGEKVSRESEEERKDVFGDLSQWHMDSNSDQMQKEREEEKKLEEEILAHYSRDAPNSPVALMKFILARPNVKLIDIVSEFDRIKTAHKLDAQEVKLGKVL